MIRDRKDQKTEKEALNSKTGLSVFRPRDLQLLEAQELHHMVMTMMVLSSYSHGVLMFVVVVVDETRVAKPLYLFCLRDLLRLARLASAPRPMKSRTNPFVLAAWNERDEGMGNLEQ